MPPRSPGRGADQLRPVSIDVDVAPYAEGSSLISTGNTRVLCTASVEEGVPRWREASGSGWVTAEYAMLPRATQTRTRRERTGPKGRTQEIQRLIGRSLRSVVDLGLFRNRTLIVDVDVLQADGGTRCAGITAGYAALHHAATRMVYDGALSEWPLQHEVAAVSVGLVEGETLVDLQYSEDVVAAVDLNVVATAKEEVVEVQGGGEDHPIPAETFVQLVAAGVTGVKRVLDIVRPQLS